MTKDQIYNEIKKISKECENGTIKYKIVEQKTISSKRKNLLKFKNCLSHFSENDENRFNKMQELYIFNFFKIYEVKFDGYTVTGQVLIPKFYLEREIQGKRGPTTSRDPEYTFRKQMRVMSSCIDTSMTFVSNIADYSSARNKINKYLKQEFLNIYIEICNKPSTRDRVNLDYFISGLVKSISFTEYSGYKDIKPPSKSIKKEFVNMLSNDMKTNYNI